RMLAQNVGLTMGLVANPPRPKAGARDDNYSAARDAFAHPLRSLAGTGFAAYPPTTNAAKASARAGTILNQLDTLIGRVGRIGMARLSEQPRPDSDSGQENECRRPRHCCLFPSSGILTRPAWP